MGIDYDTNVHPSWKRYRLTLSQFAVSASEQEPLDPAAEDGDVEEILMTLRHHRDSKQQGNYSLH